MKNIFITTLTLSLLFVSLNTYAWQLIKDGNDYLVIGQCSVASSEKCKEKIEELENKLINHPTLGPSGAKIVKDFYMEHCCYLRINYPSNNSELKAALKQLVLKGRPRAPSY